MSRENLRSVPTGGNSCLPQYPRVSPLAPRLLASLASHSPAYTSDTTAPALLNEFLTQVHALGQEHIGDGAPILVEAVTIDRNFQWRL
jgi:hypothetical protein